MLLLLACVLSIVVATSVRAWGPGTHLEFEERAFRKRRQRLPATTARLLEDNREAWQYGHIAADIINFKAVGGPYSHCHRWGIVAEMQGLAQNDFQRAFTYGYLAHLAADTIAHNHFVPYHLARYARTKGLGHLYWEMSADRFVPDERWDVVTRLKRMADIDQLDQLVNRTVPKKALSLSTNKVIFNHVLLVSERRRWRDGVERIHPRKGVDLKRGFLDRFRDAAVERILLALQTNGVARIEHVDANGKSAQKSALQVSRTLLERLHPRRRVNGEAEALAHSFLDGMESPPPRGDVS